MEAVKVGKNPFDNFLGGARQGFGVWWRYVAPAITMAYVITMILEKTGVMDLFSNYGGPVMILFGALPGAAMVPFVTGILSKGGGTAAAAALYMQGLLTGSDLAILLVLIMACGGLVGQWLRIVCVAGTDSSRQGWMWAVAFAVGLITSWIMRLWIIAVV